jgi:pimeloyl-ACP methyl ester carboxylesterase
MSATDWWRAAVALCPVAPDVCVGHSFGSSVLMDWMLGGATPPPLRGLVLVSPFFHSGRHPVHWGDLDRFACRVPDRLAAALRAHLAAEDGPTPTPSVQAAMVRMLARRLVPDGLLEFFRLYLKSRRWCLPALPCPVQLIVGDADEGLVQDSAAALAQALPLVQATRIAGCGHHPMHEQPEPLARQLACFLDTLGVIDGMARGRFEPRTALPVLEQGA